jgi:hypothetical protein
MQLGVMRIAILAADEHVRGLIIGLVLERGMTIRADDSDDAVAAVILYVARAGLLGAALRDARIRFACAPTLVVLPFDDGALEAAARAVGADACFSLGTPIAKFFSALDRALVGAVPQALQRRSPS